MMSLRFMGHQCFIVIFVLLMTLLLFCSSTYQLAPMKAPRTSPQSVPQLIDEMENANYDDFRLCRILTPRNIRSNDLFIGYSSKNDALYAYLSRTVRQIPSAALIKGGTIFKYETTQSGIIPVEQVGETIGLNITDNVTWKRRQTAWKTVYSKSRAPLSDRWSPTVQFIPDINSFLVMGGKDKSGKKLMSDMWLFNVTQNEWELLENESPRIAEEALLSSHVYQDGVVLMFLNATYLYNLTSRTWDLLAENPHNITNNADLYTVGFDETTQLFYLLDVDLFTIYTTSLQNRNWTLLHDYSEDIAKYKAGYFSSYPFPGKRPNFYWDPQYQTLGVMNDKAMLFNATNLSFSELVQVKLLFVQKMRAGGYDAKRAHVYFTASVKLERSGLTIIRRQQDSICYDAYNYIDPDVFRYSGIASGGVAVLIFVFATIVISIILIRQRILNKRRSRASESEIVSNEHKQLDLSTNPNILITYLSLYFNVIIFSLQYIIIFVPCYVLLEVFVQDSLVEFFFDSIGVLIDSKRPEISALIYLCTILLIPLHTNLYYFLLSVFFYKNSSKVLSNQDRSFYAKWKAQSWFNPILIVKCLALAIPVIGATLVYVAYFFFADYYLQAIPQIQGAVSVIRNVILIGSNFVLTQLGNFVFRSIIPQGTEWYELNSSVYQAEVSIYTYFVNILIVKIVLGFLGYMDYITLRSIVIDINLGIVVSLILSESLQWIKSILRYCKLRMDEQDNKGVIFKITHKCLTFMSSEHYEWTAQWYSYLSASRLAMVFCVLSPVVLIVAALCIILVSGSMGLRLLLFPPREVYSPAIATATIRVQLHSLHPMRMVIYTLLVLMVIILAPGRTDNGYYYIFLMIPLELALGLSARVLNIMIYCCFVKREQEEPAYFSEMMNLGYEPFMTCGYKGCEGYCFECTHFCTGRGAPKEALFTDIELKDTKHHRASTLVPRTDSVYKPDNFRRTYQNRAATARRTTVNQL